MSILITYSYFITFFFSAKLFSYGLRYLDIAIKPPLRPTATPLTTNNRYTLFIKDFIIFIIKLINSNLI